jgi:Spy/CpxP family protein refolding chaperone
MGGNTPDRPERGQQREMNPLQWVELIMSLDLDAAQRRAFEERIRTIRAQHEAYRRTSGREIQRLRRQVSGAESNSVAEGVALQRRIQLLQQGAPNFQGVQEELWSMLTPEQQKEMRSRIENSRGRLQRDRGPMRGDDTSMSEMGMTITDGAQIASEDLARYRARLAFLKRLRDRAAMD